MDRDQLSQNPTRNSDEVPEGTPGGAENICRRCAGSGKINGGGCPDCGGTGKVLTPVGGAG
ncbi:DnaJ-class molecular chaperone [Neorhizobium sp. 2083]|nr:DnaJ-class molecular chaperone [Neorhizobium sp. 2083]